MTHICVSKLTIIGSNNGLSPGRRQAIIWTNAGLLSIGPMRTYFSENLIKIQQFSLKKMHVKMSSAKWRSSCLGLNVLITIDCRELMSRVREDGHRIMDAQPSEATVGNMVRRGRSEDRQLQQSLFVTSNISSVILHKRHTIACLSGEDIGWLLEFDFWVPFTNANQLISQYG